MVLGGVQRNLLLRVSSLAFKLAWKHLSKDQRKPNIAQRLHDSTRRQLQAGATEAVLLPPEAPRTLVLANPNRATDVRVAPIAMGFFS